MAITNLKYINKMKHLPTQIENPKGLHQRYLIKKIVKKEIKEPTWRGNPYPKRTTEMQIHDVDEGSEYFVMRLDTGGSDPEHIKACRIGVHAYADAIQHHLPELANDLKERYPLL